MIDLDLRAHALPCSDPIDVIVSYRAKAFHSVLIFLSCLFGLPDALFMLDLTIEHALESMNLVHLCQIAPSCITDPWKEHTIDVGLLRSIA